MARKPKSEQQSDRSNESGSENDSENHDGGVAVDTGAAGSNGSEASDSAGNDDGNQPLVPLRASNELLPNVISAGQTITGCSESEVKNYLATADFVCRKLSVLLADKWPKICKTARHVGEEGEKAAKVSIAVKIEIDHTNILRMDTKVSLSFAEKTVVAVETQEDLSQTEFPLTT